MQILSILSENAYSTGCFFNIRNPYDEDIIFMAKINMVDMLENLRNSGLSALDDPNPTEERNHVLAQTKL